MERVFVYFNLHKKVWSVKSLKTGRVIAHANFIELKDCKFKVSKRGRERVLLERRKNVHAGVVGTIVAIDNVCSVLQNKTFQLITYNPYKYETFVSKKDETPVYQSETVSMIVSQNKASVYATK